MVTDCASAMAAGGGGGRRGSHGASTTIATNARGLLQGSNNAETPTDRAGSRAAGSTPRAARARPRGDDRQRSLTHPPVPSLRQFLQRVSADVVGVLHLL